MPNSHAGLRGVRGERSELFRDLADGQWHSRRQCGRRERRAGVRQRQCGQHVATLFGLSWLSETDPKSIAQTSSTHFGHLAGARTPPARLPPSAQPGPPGTGCGFDLVGVNHSIQLVGQCQLELHSVPIRLAQTHTICSGGDPKNQGFKEL
jgi:hypothetical protein